MSSFQSSYWSFIPGGITAPNGFHASGVSAGLKPSQKLDLALILAPQDALCVGAFTQSEVRAKCVDLSVERLRKTDGLVRAILVNAGQANACTGNRGLTDSLIATNAVSKKLGLLEEEVLICSTGVIGQPIPIQKLLGSVNLLVESLSKSGASDAAKAILTTDLCEKHIAIEAFLGGRCVRIGGMAKGSGMIHPNMATMLGFLTCDVGLPKAIWQGMIKRVVNCSFNSISVDGDTSTNDSFLAFAQGEDLEQKYFQVLEEGLKIVSTSLAKSIARDGEGSNCLIEIKIEGAESILDAQTIARTISSSSLVKTAVHGCDPNWGRIVAAAGNAGIPFDLEDVSLWIGKYQLMEKGLPLLFDRDSVSNYMRNIVKGDGKETLNINLNIGKGIYEGFSWGCDLSSDYVKINADYTT
ncbi:Glutamate N-acetyltransferase [Prochlorococcus sp. MIT 0602]|uniref:bifunctional glutamate N-acetyltransferase/amino-acid acetyltransferase ArgJ n=1 Tax=Prochlorococcus sp. MIT 0602 TaxID=1499499 RepID=UPI00053398B6|nr:MULTISPECIES: bifunctional glutamate N-acetyltransferase/amino-acid acetyltransferase ArgJ [unclassified Prochlorococcus]KGG16897.1 Glutamate N-acetyltransferase [Prochlorococcus sp. MIT 0602]KGG18128.1 Glutamate N-acetyltransferase [Prochlorococcus sp. MIT 0603]